jgi:O-antigen/teichoic acid export membrane protein
MLAVVTLAVLLGAIAILAAPAIAAWARVERQEAGAFIGAFRLGVIGSVLLMIYNGILAAARGTQMTGVVNVGQVSGAAAGLVASIVLLQAGYGLWALALGILVRGLVCAASAAVFLLTIMRQDLLRMAAPSAAVLREILALAPPLAGASAGYLLANNSEVVLVTTFFGPTAAAIYGLTRRAADGVRHLIDAIAWAVYGAFAHLVTADDRHRARAVAADVLWSRFGIASVAGAVLVAINEPFVTLLFGAEHFGGVALTVGFALHMMLGGQAFLANYLYRAAGGVRDGAWLLLADAVGRVIAMTLALLAVGLVGAPFAAVAVSVAALVVVRRRLDAAVPAGLEPPHRLTAIQRATPFVVFGAGLALGYIGVPATWRVVGGMAALMGAAGTVAVLLALPRESYGRTFIPWKRA